MFGKLAGSRKCFNGHLSPTSQAQGQVHNKGIRVRAGSLPRKWLKERRGGGRERATPLTSKNAHWWEVGEGQWVPENQTEHSHGRRHVWHSHRHPNIKTKRPPSVAA